MALTIHHGSDLCDRCEELAEQTPGLDHVHVSPSESLTAAEWPWLRMDGVRRVDRVREDEAA
jgi:hypothetical protein